MIFQIFNKQICVCQAIQIKRGGNIQCWPILCFWSVEVTPPPLGSAPATVVSGIDAAGDPLLTGDPWRSHWIQIKIWHNELPPTHTKEGFLPGVTAQINPPPNYTRVYSGLYPGINCNIPWGIVWELPDYTPGYILGAPRVYPTSPDYTPSDAGWGIVWEIGVYSGRYYI